MSLYLGTLHSLHLPSFHFSSFHSIPIILFIPHFHFSLPFLSLLFSSPLYCSTSPLVTPPPLLDQPIVLSLTWAPYLSSIVPFTYHLCPVTHLSPAYRPIHLVSPCYLLVIFVFRRIFFYSVSVSLFFIQFNILDVLCCLLLTFFLFCFFFFVLSQFQCCSFVLLLFFS